MKIGKEDYHKYTNLYTKQNWLLQKKDELAELIEFCGDRESKDLIFALLERFHYLQPETYNFLLNEMSEYIVDHSGFSQDSTQLLSLTFDDETDSSQKILYEVRSYVNKRGWTKLKTVNLFKESITNFQKGKTQILIVDEFVGSGKTLRGRIRFLRKHIPGKFEVKCCFVAGIKEEIEKLNEEGISVFCPMALEKGVSGFYKGEELTQAENLMLNLELRLAQNINKKDLYTYSFGYGGAEAIYSLEGCNGNTPNSVFPIFWWLEDIQKKIRRTLLTRIETGF